jgi:neutral amino acid transport system ATP-binding protein
VIEAGLECRGLTRAFGGVLAVDDVSATFEAGKVTALVGPNGAGKTTLFHLIAGALTPSSGEVLYRCRNLCGLSPWHIARLGVGRLFQDVRVFKRLSVLENVLVACREQRGEYPLGALVAWRRSRRDEERHTEMALRWLRLVDLVDSRQVPAGALSYGQQKLLAIVRLVAMEANVLLLDEPAAGLHPMLIERLLGVVRGLAREGRTVVVIEHNMTVVLQVADWVYFMEEGQIVAFGSPQEVLDDPDVRATYLGLGTGRGPRADLGHARQLAAEPLTYRND